jgi:hypothetical protein
MAGDTSGRPARPTNGAADSASPTPAEAARKAAKRGGAAAGTAKPRTGNGAPSPAIVPAAIEPAAAVARHLEWLEFALAAARSEVSWRQDRLAKSTKKNRIKRTDRLADVDDEVAELTALLAGLRALLARPERAPRPRRTAGPTSTRKRRTAAPRRRPAPAADAG